MYSALFHPQYHDRGDTLEQVTEPPTGPWAPQQYGCPLPRVCVHGVCVFTTVCALGRLNAEHKFRVRVTIFGQTPMAYI